MVAIAADASAGKYAREAADAARMLRHTMQPRLHMTLYANGCFRTLLAGDTALWDELQALRLTEELSALAPSDFEDELLHGTGGCIATSDKYRGSVLRGGVLRGDHPLKKKVCVCRAQPLRVVAHPCPYLPTFVFHRHSS